MRNPSYVKSLSWIVFSLLFGLGIGFKGVYFYQKNNRDERRNPDLFIRGIYQTGLQKEALSTVRLSELLGISVDFPIHYLDFNEKEAEKKLKSYPFFKEVQIEKRKPGAIYIDYTLREPIAIVKDYSDCAIDLEGVFFPYRAFYTTKKLPEIYYGAIESDLTQELKELSLETLQIAEQFLKGQGYQIECVDVSKAFIENYPKQEIVLSIKTVASQFHFSYYLRLKPIDLNKQFSNFLVLSKELAKQEKLFVKLHQSKKPKSKIIDLRIDGMALID